MNRIYLAVTGDSVSVYHRPTHQLINIGSIKEMKAFVKSVLSLDTKEYYTWLINRCRFKVALEGRKRKDYIANVKESEDWYKGAWKSTTEKFLNKYHLKNIIEEVPFELIDKLKEEKEAREHRESLLDARPINEDSDKSKKAVKLVKVVKDSKPKKKALVRAKGQNEGSKKLKRKLVHV